MVFFRGSEPNDANTKAKTAMNSDFLIYLGFFVLIGVLFIFIFLKEQQLNKKFSKYTIVIENLINENYELKKKIQEFQNTSKHDDINITDISNLIDIKVAEALNKKISPIVYNIKNIEQIIEDFHNDQQDKLVKLEEYTKNFARITPPSFDSQEDKIIKLFNDGKSVENIAKDLKIGVGRVNMVLKFHKVI